MHNAQCACFAGSCSSGLQQLKLDSPPRWSAQPEHATGIAPNQHLKVILSSLTPLLNISSALITSRITSTAARAGWWPFKSIAMPRAYINSNRQPALSSHILLLIAVQHQHTCACCTSTMTWLSSGRHPHACTLRVRFHTKDQSRYPLHAASRTRQPLGVCTPCEHGIHVHSTLRVRSHTAAQCQWH
jgi:hypothetical protein